MQHFLHVLDSLQMLNLTHSPDVRFLSITATVAYVVALAGKISKTSYQFFGSIHHRATSSFVHCKRFTCLLNLGRDEVIIHFEDTDFVPEAEERSAWHW